MRRWAIYSNMAARNLIIRGEAAGDYLHIAITNKFPATDKSSDPLTNGFVVQEKFETFWEETAQSDIAHS